MSDKIIKVKDFTNKEKCDCGAIAVWWYAPGYSKDENSFHCDLCVPRGCSCNWNYLKKEAYGPGTLSEDCVPEGVEGKDWKFLERPGDEEYEEIKKGEVWVYIDENKKEYPCCEYWYEEDGWEKNEE